MITTIQVTTNGNMHRLAPTTNHPEACPHVLQLAWSISDASGKLIDIKSTILARTEIRHWDEKTLKRLGYAPEEILQIGKNPLDAYTELLQTLRKTNLLVGFNLQSTLSPILADLLRLRMIYQFSQPAMLDLQSIGQYHCELTGIFGPQKPDLPTLFAHITGNEPPIPPSQMTAIDQAMATQEMLAIMIQKGNIQLTANYKARPKAYRYIPYPKNCIQL